MIIKKRNQKSGEVKDIQNTPVIETIQADVELENNNNIIEQEQPAEQSFETLPKEPEIDKAEIDLFDIESIDFTQRQER